MSHSPVPAPLAMVHEDVRELVEAVGRAFERLSGRTLLLTGANGFLASYVADTIVWLNEHLLPSPCFLIALVRAPLTREQRLGHLLGRPDVQFLHQDVSAPIELARGIDYIVHTASRASPRSYLAHPLDTMDANVVATRQLLELARRQGVESFLFLSSSEIYGEMGTGLAAIPETYPGSVACTSPRACYTESKRYGETLCVTFWREYGVPAKIARPFHTYGPGLRLDDGRVMADFLRNRLQNQPVQLLSDGSGVRAFCYVSDAVAGFWQVLFSERSGEAFNIGNDHEPIAVRDLAALVAELDEPLLGVELATSGQALHLRGTPSRVCPDLGKARRLLGYQPRVGLRAGLARTLAWHRATLEQQRAAGVVL
ncbi:MAG: NAD-dependent epimerase/dehydratase family protein [Chloroflexi bacterium]|nr:NAD-dependent epimerase/dehydratase family protein [Chloroflexota bacterium]